MSVLLRESLPTPLGKLLVYSDLQGELRLLDWFDNAERIHAWLHRSYRTWQVQPTREPSLRTERLRRYFDGALEALNELPLAVGGSPVQQRVWAAVRAIPAGQTCSYASLAERIGQPGSARAVGAAVGANPLLLVLPCHRVVGAKGALTGYAAGLERKRWLLEHEGVLPRLAHGASGRALRVPG